MGPGARCELCGKCVKVQPLDADADAEACAGGFGAVRMDHRIDAELHSARGEGVRREIRTGHHDTRVNRQATSILSVRNSIHGLYDISFQGKTRGKTRRKGFVQG